jgi:hypothetical protein
LFGGEESQFPDNYCVINLLKSLEELGGDKELQPDQVAKMARDQSNIADFGLSFLFDVQKELVLSTDVIEVLYRAICKVALKKPKDLVPIPEIPEDADEEAKEELQNQIESIKAENEIIEKENVRINKIKTKVSINNAAGRVYDEEKEQALLKVNNYRDAAA